MGKGKEATILSRTVPIYHSKSGSSTNSNALVHHPYHHTSGNNNNNNKDWTIVVWEWEKPSAIIEAYWQVENYGLAFGKHRHHLPLLDPFGLVTWPGAVVAAQEMADHVDWILGKRVLVLGAGVGVEAQVAAQLGASHVVATDIHPTTLQLLRYGTEQAGLSCRISTQLLDIGAYHPPKQEQQTQQTRGRRHSSSSSSSSLNADHAADAATTTTTHHHQPLPECDVMIVADVLYNQQLACQVVQRIVEARTLYNAKVLVTDSQRFVTDFDTSLTWELQKQQDAQQKLYKQKQQQPSFSSLDGTKFIHPVQWTSRWLPAFTGSGVLLDADQTYEVKARSMWVHGE